MWGPGTGPCCFCAPGHPAAGLQGWAALPGLLQARLPQPEAHLHARLNEKDQGPGIKKFGGITLDTGPPRLETAAVRSEQAMQVEPQGGLAWSAVLVLHQRHRG